MPFEFATAENIGDRKEQQDRVAGLSHPEFPDVVLVAVADGMGGHTGGALAAQSVIDSVATMFATYRPGLGPAEEWLKGMVLTAHEKVASTGQGFNRDPRSTCVLAIAQPGRIDWAHCGDSRLYLFRDNHFERRTEDHSLVEILFQQGNISEDEMLTHPDRSRLFSSLGGPDAPQVSVGCVEELRPRDTVLLCSDGLWPYFAPAEMADLIAHRDLASACDRLIQLARRRAGGSGDNVSVAILRQPGKVAKSGLMATLFGSRDIRPSPFEDARRFALRNLREVKGADVDTLSNMLQGCKSSAELQACIPSVVAAFENRLGAAKAQVFATRLLGLLEEA